MNTVLAITVLLIVAAAVSWAVERNHRRVGYADRSPYGVGLEAGRGQADAAGLDRDADRVWVDLITVRAHQSATLLPRLPRSTTSPRAARSAPAGHHLGTRQHHAA